MATYQRTGGSSPSAYLETSLVFGISSQDLDAEQSALLQILKAYKRGSLNLFTSHVTNEEIQQGNDTGLDEAIYALLRDVPAVEEEWLFPQPLVTTPTGGSRLAGPVVVRESELGELEAILPHRDDARHVFQAMRNQLDYFVTADKRSIIRHAPTLEARFPIRVVTPSQLVAELGL
jgi:hypothetical protein